MKTRPVEERFWEKVRKDSSTGCWRWTGHLDRKGRGRFYTGGRMVSASRVAWTLLHGDPGPHWVLHKCDNGQCVNAESHFFLGDNEANMKDMSAKRRAAGQKKTHCPKGHPYSGENLFIRKGAGGNRRLCRECHRAHGRATYRRSK
jgi:hypothetical protein